MSEAFELTPAGPNSNRALRFVVTVAIFTLVVPVVAAAVTILGYLVFGFPVQPANETSFYLLAGSLAYGLWKAHPLGFATAAGLGAIIAVRDLFGGTRFFEAVAISGAIGVVWAWLIASGKMHDLFTQLVVVSFVIATIACWAAICCFSDCSAETSSATSFTAPTRVWLYCATARSYCASLPDRLARSRPPSKIGRLSEGPAS